MNEMICPWCINICESSNSRLGECTHHGPHTEGSDCHNSICARMGTEIDCMTMGTLMNDKIRKLTNG
jgi:hypothetical protein